MRLKHGQSKHTQTKQRHLIELLKRCINGWNPTNKLWAHSNLLAIDCTAGSGYAVDGQPGSPLIINDYLCKHHADHFRQLCCEEDRSNFQKLRALPLYHCDVVHGRYQDIVPGWIKDQGIASSKEALGFIYVDVNGAIDLIEGMPIFVNLADKKALSTHRLDLMCNWSINAYKRHGGVGAEWAATPILDQLRALAALKKKTYLRSPLGNLEWVLSHGMNTDKVPLSLPDEEILLYDAWVTKYGYLAAGGDRHVSQDQLTFDFFSNAKGIPKS